MECMTIVPTQTMGNDGSNSKAVMYISTSDKGLLKKSPNSIVVDTCPCTHTKTENGIAKELMDKL